MLDAFAVVLCRPKFPENVGAAARACANMGCSELVVVAPQRFTEDWERQAMALATPKGAPILRHMRMEQDLVAALAPYTTVYGTTARTGGWRKGIQTPAQAASGMVETLREGGSVAVVFGSEDRGLTNAEIEICGQLLTIPTADDASSLNLAQAVLVVLYEVFTKSLDKPFRPAGPSQSRLTTHQEQETLYATVQETLRHVDFFKDENEEYWMLPFRRFLQRIKLRRNEFNLIMGVCRQVQWLARQAGRAVRK
jgi:tRNA/rRNA methyltransferase